MYVLNQEEFEKALMEAKDVSKTETQSAVSEKADPDFEKAKRDLFLVMMDNTDGLTLDDLLNAYYYQDCFIDFFEGSCGSYLRNFTKNLLQAKNHRKRRVL